MKIISKYTQSAPNQHPTATSIRGIYDKIISLGPANVFSTNFSISTSVF